MQSSANPNWNSETLRVQKKYINFILAETRNYYLIVFICTVFINFPRPRISALGDASNVQ
jgi:hypothetical protein